MDLNPWTADKQLSMPIEGWITRPDGTRVHYWLMEPTRIEMKAQEHFEEDVMRGRLLFADACALCHGSDASGVFGPPPPPALNPPRHAARFADDGEIVRFITETTKQGRPGTPMPPWGAFYGGGMTDQEVESIVAYIFAIQLGLLPTVGRQDVLINIDHPTNFYVLDGLITRDWTALWDAIKHLILPAIALGSIPLAVITRITRAAVLDVQNEDYVRTARAKGLAPRLVDTRHVLRNALLPISTIIGLQTGLLLSGAVLTETVFAWPGMGTWLVEAIEFRNYPVLQGGILFVSVVFVLVNLVVDISYAIINPRIRIS
jgi:mono/diheme cytochrome c family protein